MASIVYDFSAIAAAMKGDDWFAPAKPIAEPEKYREFLKEMPKDPPSGSKVGVRFPPSTFIELMRERSKRKSLLNIPDDRYDSF